MGRPIIIIIVKIDTKSERSKKRFSMGKQNGRSISLVYDCCNNILFCRFVIEIEIFFVRSLIHSLHFKESSQLRAYCVCVSVPFVMRPLSAIDFYQAINARIVFH